MSVLGDKLRARQSGTYVPGVPAVAPQPMPNSLMRLRQNTVPQAPAWTPAVHVPSADPPALSLPQIWTPLGDKLAERQARQAANPLGGLVENPVAEMERIIKMPIHYEMSPEEEETYNRMNLLADAYNGGFRLFSPQANGLAEYEETGGLVGSIPVGYGKTLLGIMITEKAYKKGIGQILLFLPAQVYDQLVSVDVRWARQRVPISYPIHLMGGRDKTSRRMIAKSGKKGLYVIPYSLLSVPDTYELMEAINPGLILGDEVHSLARPAAARTKRVKHYIDTYHPEFVALSGTITSKSLRDYAHILRWALGQNNPLPNASGMAIEWANILDSTASEITQAPNQSFPLWPLVHWARKNFPEKVIRENLAGFRQAFQLRLTTAPGYVGFSGKEIGTSLIIVNTPVENYEAVPNFMALQKHIDNIEQLMVTPNGDQLEHPMLTYKWLSELSAGFYNALYWPSPEDYARNRNMTAMEAENILDRAKEHHDEGQIYSSLLSKWLKNKSRPGLDTPMLVGRDMYVNGATNVGGELHKQWLAVRAKDFEGRPERDATPVRVCDYKVKQVLAYVKELQERDGKDTGALIWTFHVDFGLWIHESLKQAGIDSVHCPAGANEVIRKIGDPNMGGKGDRIVVASFVAHGQGKNLQAFQHQFFAQWPRAARTAEQTIGRTHRNGQTADELIVCTNLTLEWDRINFGACLNDALYIQQTTGGRQKLIYSRYNPFPKIYPPGFLAEKGMQPKMLTEQQQAILADKFLRSA